MLSTQDQARVRQSGFVTGGWKLWLLKAAGWLLRSKLLLWHLRRRGIATVFWSYDDERDFAEAFAIGPS